MSRVAMDILTFTNFTSGLRAAPRITGDDQPRASTLLTAEMQKLGPSTGCLGSAPPCPTLSTCHLRKLTRVMCLCLHVSQVVLIKGRHAFISSASPLCGCSFCPGCTWTTATRCRAAARCRRAPARLWAAPCGCRAPARCRRCPTLSTRHSRMVTRVMCLCLQISQAVQRPPCFTCSASPPLWVFVLPGMHPDYCYMLSGSCTLPPCSCSLLPCSCLLPPMLNSVYVSLERADQSFVYKSASRPICSKARRFHLVDALYVSSNV